MSILEIIWVLATVGLIWLIVVLPMEGSLDFAILLIILVLLSLIFMICHWWDFLTKPLWD